jgi:hypothetical protein
MLSDEQVEGLVERAVVERIAKRRTLLLDDPELRRAAIDALGDPKKVSLAEVSRALGIPSSNFRDLISKITGRTPSNGGLQILKGVLEHIERTKSGS